MRLTKSYTICASHSLPLVPDGHKCKRLHGHNWTIGVTVAGQVGANGMVMDYGEIGKICKPIVEGLDHRHLNDIVGLENPTSENLCLWLWAAIKPHLPNLAQISVAETDNTLCVYDGS